VTGAQLATILRVIIEVLRGQEAILIADKAILGHLRRIELHLDLRILRDGHQRGSHLLHEDLPRLHDVVDIRIVAVALVGEGLHAAVLEVARAEARTVR
jgi:hypothetical protein